MPPPRVLPDELLTGPFTSRRAAELGVSEKVLRGRRFRRLHPRVWVHTDHAMSDLDTIRAAGLAMPSRARLSHESRLRAQGLEVLESQPVHFTVQGELHLDLDGIALHRTKVMPPTDDVGVSSAAAFVQTCRRGDLADVVARGDWLLHRRLVTRAEIAELCAAQSWRPGAAEARRVVPLLDGRSASLPESRLRLVVAFSGLPPATPNVDLVAGDQMIARSDLVLADWHVLLEYEGRQHATDLHQWQRDLVRYGELRALGWAYLQVTHEMLMQPRALVLHLEALLRSRGYTGPGPRFDRRWRSLFVPVGPGAPFSGDLASTGMSVVDARSPLRRRQ